MILTPHFSPVSLFLRIIIAVVFFQVEKSRANQKQGESIGMSPTATTFWYF